MKLFNFEILFYNFISKFVFLSFLFYDYKLFNHEKFLQNYSPALEPLFYLIHWF